MLDLLQIQANVKDPTWGSILYSVLASFVFSVLIAKTYQKTFQGLSYSRNFLQALILGSLVTCIAMQAIGDNMARGFGMMGALAIIRFRSTIKDPKDIIYIFAALTLGIACGVYQIKLGAVGTLAFCAVALFLHVFPLGQETQYDGLLRFSARWKGQESELAALLERHCRTFVLVTLRELAQGARLDHAYQIKLKHEKGHAALVQELKALSGTEGVALMLQEATIEV